MTGTEHPGLLIRRARLARHLTQAQLAQMLMVTPKAVSKWERGAGQPDVSLIPALSQALGLSSDALLTGQIPANPPDGGNMKRIHFYRCPECGSLLTATGKPEISCCGRRLAPLTAIPADGEHALTVSDIETEKLVQWTHPMDKTHHLTFLAAVGYDCVHIVRLYPEGAQEHRLPRIPWAKYVCGCSQDPEKLFVLR